MANTPQDPPQDPARFSPARSLSARLLLLTIFFVMLAEVLIYVPSIARFRAVYLSERLAAAQLASLALEAAPDQKVSRALEQELLANAGAYAVVLSRDDSRHLMLSSHRDVEADLVFDVREDGPWTLIMGAFDALWPYNKGHGENGDRVIRVVGPPRLGGGVVIESIIDEGPLKMEMYDYSGRILSLSIVISLITASLVFLSLRMLLVRPIQRITRSMVAFREAPEDVSRVIAASDRRDEIGTAQRTLAEMQEQIRVALKQKTRLAALGAAVSKVNHDLRNILANAQLISDRLAGSDDPTVRKVAPTLVAAIDHAVNLCTDSLQFGKPSETLPRRVRFPLDALIPDLKPRELTLKDLGITWQVELEDDLEVDGDPEQIFRVLLNLVRNAMQAIEAGIAESGNRGGDKVSLKAWRESTAAIIEVCDSGSGIPEDARETLFEAFKGSGRADGTGLGLSIARDLVDNHGGRIALMQSGEGGTTFRVEIPDT